jgi:hypothetical protein
MNFSTHARHFLQKASLKNLAVDCYSGNFSPSPPQKKTYLNAKNSHAESIVSMIVICRAWICLCLYQYAQKNQ